MVLRDHGRSRHSLLDAADQVCIRRERTARSGLEFILPFAEVSRLRLELGSHLSLTIPRETMADRAVGVVDCSSERLPCSVHDGSRCAAIGCYAEQPNDGEEPPHLRQYDQLSGDMGGMQLTVDRKDAGFIGRKLYGLSLSSWDHFLDLVIGDTIAVFLVQLINQLHLDRIPFVHNQ